MDFGIEFFGDVVGEYHLAVGGVAWRGTHVECLCVIVCSDRKEGNKVSMRIRVIRRGDQNNALDGGFATNQHKKQYQDEIPLQSQRTLLLFRKKFDLYCSADATSALMRRMLGPIHTLR